MLLSFAFSPLSVFRFYYFFWMVYRFFNQTLSFASTNYFLYKTDIVSVKIYLTNRLFLCHSCKFSHSFIMKIIITINMVMVDRSFLIFRNHKLFYLLTINQDDFSSIQLYMTPYKFNKKTKIFASFFIWSFYYHYLLYLVFIHHFIPFNNLFRRMCIIPGFILYILVFSFILNWYLVYFRRSLVLNSKLECIFLLLLLRHNMGNTCPSNIILWIITVLLIR